MAKYKIKVIAHSLKNNKIAKSGDVIDESAFVVPETENIDVDVEVIDVGVEEVVDPKTMNKSKLIAYAEEIGADIVVTDSKAEILQQVLNHLA
jgi:hypothetical protein